MATRKNKINKGEKLSTGEVVEALDKE